MIRDSDSGSGVVAIFTPKEANWLPPPELKSKRNVGSVQEAVAVSVNTSGFAEGLRALAHALDAEVAHKGKPKLFCPFEAQPNALQVPSKLDGRSRVNTVPFGTGDVRPTINSKPCVDGQAVMLGSQSHSN
jgi:hypothetical protein